MKESDQRDRRAGAYVRRRGRALPRWNTGMAWGDVDPDPHGTSLNRRLELMGLKVLRVVVCSDYRVACCVVKSQE